MTEPDNRHIGVLDGLRAMAILLVLATHGMGKVWLNMSRPFLPIGHFDLANFLRNGWAGVDLFFTLSGFLITAQLIDGGIAAKAGRWRVIRRYLKRRLCRIIPAYYIMLVFTTAVLASFDPVRDHAHLMKYAYSFVAHLFFLHNYFYKHYNYTWFWSLAVEMQFYMVAPFLVMFLLRLPRPGLRYAALISLILLLAALRFLAVLYWQPVSADYLDYFFNIKILLPFSMDGILCGVLCAFMWRAAEIRAFLQRKYICNGLFFGGLALFFALTALRPPEEAGSNLFGKTFMFTFLAAAFSCMLLGLMAGSRGKNLFSSRPLRYIALVSYSMYILHMIVAQYSFDLAERLTHGLHSNLLMYFTGLAIFIAATVLLATPMYKFIEKPFNDWAKRPAAVKDAPV